MQKLIYPERKWYIPRKILLINKFHFHIYIHNKNFTFLLFIFKISYFSFIPCILFVNFIIIRFIRLSPGEMEILRYFYLQPDRTLFSCSRPESFPRVSFLCSSHSFVFVSFPFNQVSQVSTKLDRASFTSQTGESTCPKYASREGILPSGCDSKLKITLPR